jgi:hypothetical protein|tara:strand:+ start:66 stop:749 length:684 start_codon:yes stop_codon:yes gene_type:complete
MIQIRFSPQWFFGYDAAIDIISIIVVGLIAWYAFKIFKFSDRKKDKYFALSWLSIALAFLAKIAMNLVIYYPKANEVAYAGVNVVVQYTGQSRMLYVFGFAFYRFLFLMGLLGIYYLVTKEQNRYNILMTILLAIMIILFSGSQYFVFHLFAAIILAGTVYNYLWHYRKNKNVVRQNVGWGFAGLLASQVLFVLTAVHDVFYVAGQVVQLVGFLFLSFTFYTIVFKK